MPAQGQFILMSLTEFEFWLADQNITRSIKRIQNHHTWKPRYKDFKNDNHFTLLKGMKRSHLKRGFNDIAQNLTTFPDGTIAVCRPLKTIPAGIKGANTGGICIEHLGNFDKGGDRMRKKHKEIILQLNAILCKNFELVPNTDTIVYHHWWDLNSGKRKDGEGVTKSCPGTNFFGGNEVDDAKENFVSKIFDEYKKLTNGSATLVDTPAATSTELFVRYSKKGKIKYGEELQGFLNGFPGVKLKVDGWPGKKTSDAFKKVTGYYLKGDPRI
jgi:hypothetical protein